MPIEFDEAECAEIIDRVGIPASPEAATRLALALGSSTRTLIGQLQKAPFPDRMQVWRKVDHLNKPLRDFLSYYGIDISVVTGESQLNSASQWLFVLEKFSAHPNHDRPRDLEEKMTRVAKQAQKLYDDIADFKNYLRLEAGISDKEGPNARKAATRLFIQELVLASTSIFAKPLTIHNDREITGRDVHGPAITYLRACLDLAQQKLDQTGFMHIAKDPALRISVNTLADWFYELRH